jgi:hypothetical protein
MVKEAASVVSKITGPMPLSYSGVKSSGTHTVVETAVVNAAAVKAVHGHSSAGTTAGAASDPDAAASPAAVSHPDGAASKTAAPKGAVPHKAASMKTAIAIKTAAAMETATTAGLSHSSAANRTTTVVNAFTASSRQRRLCVQNQSRKHQKHTYFFCNVRKHCYTAFLRRFYFHGPPSRTPLLFLICLKNFHFPH